MSTQSSGTPEGDDERDGIPRGAEHLGRLRAAVREISTEEHGLSLETLRSPGRSDLAVNPRGGSASDDALGEATRALAEAAGRRGRPSARAGAIMLRLEDDADRGHGRGRSSAASRTFRRRRTRRSPASAS